MTFFRKIFSYHFHVADLSIYKDIVGQNQNSLTPHILGRFLFIIGGTMQKIFVFHSSHEVKFSIVQLRSGCKNFI